MVADIDRSVDDDVARRSPESRDGGVVADLEVERLRGGAVRAGLEEERIALRSELVRHLLGGDGIDGRLDLTRRHARVEDEHVRPEALWRWLRGPGRTGEDQRRGDDEETGEEPSSARHSNLLLDRHDGRIDLSCLGLNPTKPGAEASAVPHGVASEADNSWRPCHPLLGPPPFSPGADRNLAGHELRSCGDAGCAEAPACTELHRRYVGARASCRRSCGRRRERAAGDRWADPAGARHRAWTGIRRRRGDRNTPRVVALIVFVLVYVTVEQALRLAVGATARLDVVPGRDPGAPPRSCLPVAALCLACGACAATLMLLPLRRPGLFSVGPYPRWDLPLRGACAVIPIVAVTSAARALGPHLSGLLARRSRSSRRCWRRSRRRSRERTRSFAFCTG